MPSIEVETTLAICSRDAGRVADDIACLDSLGEYALHHRTTLLLEDWYLDLDGEPLREAGVGLRVRRIGQREIITLKGPAHATGAGVGREELELRWSSRALRAVCRRLNAYGVAAPSRAEAAPRDALAALNDLGYRVVQRRDTRRRPRDVTALDHSQQVVAELAVDMVRYRLRSRDVYHSEVEIEVKAATGDVAVARLSEALRSCWGAALRPWRLGKLETGRAIESSLQGGRLTRAVARDGRLLPPAYDLLEAWRAPG